MKRPENTGGLPGGASVFAEALLGEVTPGEAIEGQESSGQISFVDSDTLPTKMNCVGSAQDVLGAMGIKIIGPVPNDPLFLYVELPPGWTKVTTDHNMWSNLLDDKGRKRAAIFYKAAFYDRDAHLDPITRYTYGSDYDRQEKENAAVAIATDCGKVIFSTTPVPLPEDARKGYDLKEEARKEAKAWLIQNFPDWENPGAYWE